MPLSLTLLTDANGGAASKTIINNNYTSIAAYMPMGAKLNHVDEVVSNEIE